MAFSITKKTGAQQQFLGKTAARRKRNAGKVAVVAAASAPPAANDLAPEIKIVWRAANDLKAPARRVRKVEEAHLAATVRAICHFGLVSPLTTRGDVVVDGFVRALAARQLGIEQVPCIDVGHMSEAKARALAITLNRLGETGQWDLPELKLELADLAIEGFDLTLTGFTMPELDIILSDDADDDDADGEIPEVPVTPVSIVGDLWILQEHKVLCANALDADAYQELLGDESVTAVLTDPPYNVKIAGNVSGLGKTKHGEFKMACGEQTSAEFEAFLAAAMEHSTNRLTAGGVSSWFMDWRSIDLLMSAARSVGLSHLNTAVWNKGSGAMGAFLRSAHELVGIFCKGDKPAINNVALGRHGRDRTNVWSYPGANQPGSSGAKALKDHPTPKNVEMCADALSDVTHQGDFVLDPFLGSGTTLIAAERTGRVCRGIELEPGFVDVIVRRWEALTGHEAMHAATGVTFAQTKDDRLSPDI